MHAQLLDPVHCWYQFQMESSYLLPVAILERSSNVGTFFYHEKLKGCMRGHALNYAKEEPSFYSRNQRCHNDWATPHSYAVICSYLGLQIE